MDLSHWIDRHACFTPQAVALRFQGAEIGYAELRRRIDAATSALDALGVTAGDVVAYLGLNHPLELELLFACARLGALFAPVNWRLAPPEHARVFADCRPRVLVVEPAFIPPLATVADSIANAQRIAVTDAPAGWTAWSALLGVTAAAPPPARVGRQDSPLLLCYTSGTTGQPKGVVHDQAALQWNAVNSTHMHDLTSADRVLTTLPLFHVGGLNIQTLPALHAGACVSLHPRFDPAATLAALEEERITLTVLVPAQVTVLAELPRWPSADFTALRMITTGSTIISEEFARRINARGVPFAQVYGSTETAPIAAYQRAADALSRPGSAGAVALHTEIRIVDLDGQDVPTGVDGEILVRGPNVMRGYWRQPEQTALVLRDGWYASGDLGHLDADGFLYVVARKRDMIITGGENVYPEEIESLLLQCPGVTEVCVVGRPDERLGEMVVAAIVTSDGDHEVPELRARLEQRIARYKLPREVYRFESLPRNALGKLRRNEVRRMVTEMAEEVCGRDARTHR